ncbi:MAG TPA: thiamine pyrophosphate-dependent enzyme, partial [Candidatus Methylomirabilis sp.]|nr:thiamine pyrophosphate-dependent enzyme [Candidatus Methylomirabilis sp.]
AFLSATGIPAVGTYEAAGVVGRKLLDQFLGRVGLSAEEPGDVALREADVVVTIGYDLIEYAPSMWLTGATVIHVDRLPSEVDAVYRPAAELVGEIGRSIERLQEAVGEKRWTLTQDERKAKASITREHDLAFYKNKGGIHPARVVVELRSALKDDDLLISDVGAHQIWLAREFYSFQPRSLLFSMGFQTMGVSLPWAMAARLVDRKRRIVSCSGDGSFLMSAMELETAVRRKLPIVHLVWRDGTYNLVEIQQMAAYGRAHGTKFGNPDIVKLAESFGATGLRVTKPAEIASTLSRAFKVKGPVVIDVPVDYRHNMGLLGKGRLFAD